MSLYNNIFWNDAWCGFEPDENKLPQEKNLFFLSLASINNVLLELIPDMSMEEWWNSHYPVTDEEWCDLFPEYTEADLENLNIKEIVLFDKDTALNILFETAKKLYDKFKEITVNEFIEILGAVTFEPLIAKYNSNNNGLLYESLFEGAVYIITKQCEAFYEINKIRKEIE